MATINSLTSGSSSSYGVTSKAIGGLATGLDTDEIIKGMTIGTRSKIAKQLQSKQLFTWKSDAMRSISTKLINFSQKYTSYTSSTNLTSRSFYMKSDITTGGTNASKVTVSGSSEITDGISILSGTKSVAGSVSADAVSAKTLTGDDIDILKIADIAEKQIGFSYNGDAKAITFTADELSGVNSEAQMAALMQTKLDSAFGTGKIKVDTSADGKKLQITTSEKPSGPLGILKVTGADSDVSSILGISAGDSNRLNLGMKASELFGDPGATPELSIGGKTIALTADSTVADIISAVNRSDAGVKMTYVESLDRFEFTSTDGGGQKIITGNDVATRLFGGDKTMSASTEASITVNYKGTEMKLNSSTDSFSLDGLTIKLNESFAAGNPVTLSSKTDTEKVFSGIKDMIKDYNDIVDMTNKEYSTKNNRNYPPLTDEQREDMSESEIKAWDEKAKVGMLFGDSDLSALSNDLRSVILASGESLIAFEAIGITSSSSWKDNGKLIIDEDKLKAAIDKDPANVQKLFAGEVDAAGKKISDGAADRIKKVMDTYAKTEGSPKGILIEKAGNSLSPLSTTNNAYNTQVKDIDTFVAKLKERLATEQTRYQRQFTNLETVISNLNSQSGWLAQQFG
ncbi:flagellar filament capping protein FliD [Proteocatella sphenisci]|uniref:flagellar filament capping protein FliD n=1 Tax=Proteocatella sphenisci TaxID=181070 RepID=UPI00048D89A3|nr:flagellar filament capping protein FliD [Proteocatella sphenisci]